MTIEEFLKLLPLAFIENLLVEDPQIFIDLTLKAIRVLRCSSERVVELATYSLGVRAEQWYHNFLIGRSCNLSPLTWEEFSEAFMMRFLPISRKPSLAAKFERLT